MANRVKEDEKHERIIRGLLKLQENKRCINCNSLGPQYVCTNFWTFVCATCSGIHREFTHRVKSVSMSKFTSQEVSALQEGGNQRAKEVLLKEWDPRHQSFPDSSNVERIRNFIKHVYVDRRYTGERKYDKPPRVKMGDKDDVYDNRRTDTYQGGSRSPPYEDTYEPRYSEQSSPCGRSDDKNSRYGYDERRSTGNEQESRQYGDYRRTSPARPEVINDWHRDDRFGNASRFEDRRISDGDSKLEGRSPERPKDLESSSPPMVRPVREILGDNAFPLRISEPPKANGGRVADGSAHTQRTVSSSSLGSTNENQPEVKLETTRSLIDFDADPEPSHAASAMQAQQTTVAQSVAQPASSTNDNNWASFDFAPEVKVSQVSSNLNTLESVFSQLSVPASVSGQESGKPSGVGAPVTTPAPNVNVLPVGVNSPVVSVGHAPFSTFSAASPATPPVSGFATFPSSNVPAPAPGVTPVLPLPVNSMHHPQPSLFPTAGGLYTASQSTGPVDGPTNNQPWNMSLAQNAQGPLSTQAAQPPQAVPKPALGISSLGISSGGVSQPLPVEIKSTGRRALPEDLFMATYSSFPASAAGWQTIPPHGMGHPLQYNTAAPMLNIVQSKSTTNPFDVNTDSSPVQAQTVMQFPSMVSSQGALPNVSHTSGLLSTFSLRTPSPAWMLPQSSPYPSALPSQMPTYTPAALSQMPHASATLPLPHMGPQVPGNMLPSRPQGMGGFGGGGTASGFMNPSQQLAGGFSAPATPQPFSSAGGNPFGRNLY